MTRTQRRPQAPSTCPVDLRWHRRRYRAGNTGHGQPGAARPASAPPAAAARSSTPARILSYHQKPYMITWVSVEWMPHPLRILGHPPHPSRSSPGGTGAAAGGGLGDGPPDRKPSHRDLAPRPSPTIYGTGPTGQAVVRIVTQLVDFGRGTGWRPLWNAGEGFRAAGIRAREHRLAGRRRRA